MRIAQLCPYDIDRPGGVQTHIRDLSAALHDLGHEVAIIAPRVGPAAAQPAEGGAGAPPIRRLGQARRIGFNGTQFEISIALGAERRRLADLLRQGGFDVVHYHTIWTPLLPLQALHLSRSANVATFHDTPPETPSGALTRLAFRGLSRWLLPRLDGVIAVSQAPARHLATSPARRLRILPPCTDLRRFGGGPAAAPPREGRVTILTIGRLETRKGVMILLKAYRRLVAQGVALRLVIAGDGPERAALQRFVGDHALPDVVFTGAFAEADKPALYASCDIFCAPALYGESFGIVLAEAMASGKPVIAAANAGYRGVLVGEGARFLAPPGDVDALCRHLHGLAGDAPLRRRLGEWGRGEAARYDCRNRAGDFLALYEEALAAARLKPRPALRRAS